MRVSIGAAALLLAVSCTEDRPAPVVPPTATVTTTTPGAAIRIMPLGDSITQGDSDHDTYRRPLWLSLVSQGYRVDFVGSLRAHHRGPAPRDDFDRDHEGHWGFRVDQILRDIRLWVSSLEPDVLLIHLGSNDVFQNQSIDDTVEELSELIDAVRELRPSATFLLAQIIPTDSGGTNGRIRELNARIPEIAAAKSTATSPVIIVDQFTGFDAATQTYDGVHPNADGEIHLSDRWLRALEEILPR